MDYTCIPGSYPALITRHNRLRVYFAIFCVFYIHYIYSFMSIHRSPSPEVQILRELRRLNADYTVIQEVYELHAVGFLTKRAPYLYHLAKEAKTTLAPHVVRFIEDLRKNGVKMETEVKL